MLDEMKMKPEDYDYYSSLSSYQEREDFVEDICDRVKPIAGYGFYWWDVISRGNDHYIRWDHLESCD